MNTTSRQHAALATGSGIAWKRWLEILEPHRDLDHTDLAAKALEAIRSEGTSTNPQWWAQNASVAYEQHIGRRVVGQKCDGSFSAGVSKTFPGTMDDVLARITGAGAELTAFAGIPAEARPSTSATEKWRYWRVPLADGSRVTITIQTKASGDKSTAAVNHDKLGSESDIAPAKAWWREFLASA